MVHYFCPRCWSDFTEDVTRCPQCGLNIHEFWDSKDHIERLVVALHHRDPETRLRAAWLLGRSKDPRAVPPLIDLIRQTQEVYLAREAVSALGNIDSDEAREFLRTLVHHPAKMVRDEAQKTLGKDKGAFDESKRG
jgi:HEAT repeat protein